MAEMSVMRGRNSEAETILLHNNKISEAIELCVRMHRWERALDIAKSNDRKSDLDSVLAQRKKYLSALNRPEYLDVFLKIHWNTEKWSNGITWSALESELIKFIQNTSIYYAFQRSTAFTANDHEMSLVLHESTAALTYPNCHLSNGA